MQSDKTQTFGRTLAQRGWEVVEGVYTREECDRIAELALKHIDHQPIGADGKPEPRKVSAAYPADVAFRRFVFDERLMSLVRQLLGGQEPRLLMDQIFMKPPRHGSPKPFHQDNAYFRCEPADEVITAWIALDDVDEANGCLCYIDGSHRGPLIEHGRVAGEEYNLTPAEKDIDLSRKRLAPVGKGGVVFHHSMTLHMSGRNHTDRWRRGFATHWVSDRVRPFAGSTIFEKACFRQPGYPRL